MKTLIIYDNTGYILMQQTGSYRVPEGGVQYLELEIPTGKIVKSINVDKKEAILEDIPKSEVEILKEQVESLTQANAELTNIVANMETKNV
ncbi:hypothetical protein HYH43_07060 [Clostridium botulinum]|uniref:hypothetical protein n=1 Tax=Clostridium botulinum TaxID=1491 RepID=UPI0007743092|nr:hypothetical protein [Clostridium botulinum]MBY6789196.1 hypothetical protein [Clostridium botulinum]MBY6948970.1 hypothetical protein [Clostridium botulinum]MBY7022910.1 hypothetical protein [Clostridium botulinum]NFI33306.1 hypothetical protein [Clostridium botulinum]NFL87458.1 hypothetical protein [Clostridium botulinum]